MGLCQVLANPVTFVGGRFKKFDSLYSDTGIPRIQYFKFVVMVEKNLKLRIFKDTLDLLCVL